MNQSLNSFKITCSRQFTNEIHTEQPNSPAFYLASPWQPWVLHMLCSSSCHLTEACQWMLHALDSPSGLTTFKSYISHVHQIRPKEAGGPPTWQKLQCEYKCTCTCRGGPAKRPEQEPLGNYLVLRCCTDIPFLTPI